VTKHDILDKLRNTEETLLIELLGLTSSDIVDQFLDLIEEKYEYIYRQVNDIENGIEEE
jgi:cell division septum initiation protein DivIVA